MTSKRDIEKYGICLDEIINVIDGVYEEIYNFENSKVRNMILSYMKKMSDTIDEARYHLDNTKIKYRELKFDDLSTDSENEENFSDDNDYSDDDDE